MYTLPQGTVFVNHIHTLLVMNFYSFQFVIFKFQSNVCNDGFFLTHRLLYYINENDILKQTGG